MEDARVFKKTPDDGANADVFRLAGHAWAQAAESANDQVDRHARLGGFAQRLDDLRVFELIHLGDDARRLPGLAILCLAAGSAASRRGRMVLGATSSEVHCGACAWPVR